MRPVRIVFSDLIFLFIIVLLAGISILSYQRITRFNAAYASVNHSDQVKLKLVQALSFLKDSEAGARGFLLTKDSAFLIPFTGSEEKTNRILASLDSLIQDSREEVQNLQALREMVSTKFKNLNEIVRNPSVTPAVNHSRLLEENQLMMQCREIILRMNRTENKFLQERTQIKDRYATITPLYSLIFSIIAIIIVILAYFRLRSETSLRFRAEDSEAKIIAAGKKLEETELRLRLAIEAASLGTFDWNFTDQTFLSSPRLNEIFGFGDQPVTHQDLIDALLPDDLPLREKAVADSYISGALTYEVRILWPDGSVRWVGVHGKVIYDDKRQPARMYGTVMDIQEQKNFTQELEDKVGQRTLSLIEANDQLENTIMDLEQSNAELESFNYVASHDLQEPLRKIIAFCQRISDKDGSGLSESSKDYFSRITRAAMRMQNLIDAFLSYSQTGNSTVNYEPVDLNLLLEEVKNDLRELIDEKKAVIQSVTLPTISAIPLQFQQLMINLISNALKYSKPNTAPVITIAASQVPGSELSEEENNPETNYWKITVSDNGIGFEQQYGHKIFELFQRLHPKSDYTGTGIGLAICKKIVRNHKGFISATGELGIGAVFSIFIPISEPKQNGNQRRGDDQI